MNKDKNFKKAIEHILKYEGGYVNHPSDPGGETNFGISKRAYPNVDIKNLTVQKAKEIYFNDYWLANKCDKMPLSTGLVVFDMSVNMGLRRTAQMLQGILKVATDGIIGKLTLGALSKRNDKEVAIELSKQRQVYYQSLKTFGTFGKGWTNRTFDVLQEIMKK